MSPATVPRPPLSSFWRDLPRDGRWLLSTVAIETFGTGLILPFGFIYLHSVRHLGVQSAGAILAIPSVVGFLVVGPAGTLSDRLGARKVLLFGIAAQLVGNLVLAFATTTAAAALAYVCVGAAFGVFWPAFNAMIGATVPSGIRQRYYGLNFSMVNLGIGVGGAVAGAFVDVHRPVTFTAIYLANAASFLPPMLVLLGPLRRASGRADAAAEAGGSRSADGPATTDTYLSILRSDRALVPVLVLAFLSAFVGYGQAQTGFTAYASLVGGVSTRTIGLAFAANTVVIVSLQLLVLQRIEGRRRTRVILLLCVLWGLSWLLTGLSGLVPGTVVASALVIGGFMVFGLGETLLQPTVSAITNDLSPDHLRGRYNAISSAAFQVASILDPAIAGLLIGARLGAEFIGMLLAGCVLLAFVARWVGRSISPEVDGIRATPNDAGAEVEAVAEVRDTPAAAEVP